MFEIPPETLEDWAEYGDPPANEAQLAHLHRLAPMPLPEAYIAFVTQYGFAQWDDALPNAFSYRMEGGGGVVETENQVSHLRTASGIERLRKHGWSEDAANGLPVAPAHMFPVGGNAGQDLILLNLKDGSVWLLPEGRQDAWGTGDNIELGYVADSFDAFINGLRSRAP